jgi:hypothetical protein
LAKHLIALSGVGFVCSCGVAYDASERSLMRKKDRPRAVASQHQLAAYIDGSLRGGAALVTNCLACQGESIIPAATDETVVAFAAWLRTPCAFCGKTPIDVSDGHRR